MNAVTPSNPRAPLSNEALRQLFLDGVDVFEAIARSGRRFGKVKADSGGIPALARGGQVQAFFQSQPGTNFHLLHVAGVCVALLADAGRGELTLVREVQPATCRGGFSGRGGKPGSAGQRSKRPLALPAQAGAAQHSRAHQTEML